MWEFMIATTYHWGHANIVICKYTQYHITYSTRMWGSLLHQDVGITTPPGCGDHYSTRVWGSLLHQDVGIITPPGCGDHYSTRMWGSLLHQDVEITTPPGCGDHYSTKMWGSLLHQDVGIRDSDHTALGTHQHCTTFCRCTVCNS